MLNCSKTDQNDLEFDLSFITFLAALVLGFYRSMKSKKISNDQELIQSDPISCPQNQKGNN